MTLGIPRTLEPGAFTPADLDSLPDGMRYELIGGQLLLTPSPLPLHQRAVARLMLVLHEHCTAGLEVFPGPVEFHAVEGHALLLPDLLVCRRKAVDELVLVVEVVSAATRTVDRILKRALYERAGVTSYWLFDPEAEELTVLELVDGAYVERAVVKGNESFDATLPFAVPVVPGELVRPVNRG